MVPVDAALAHALGDLGPAEAAGILMNLEALSARLRPDKPGPILDTLNRARGNAAQE